MILDKYTYFYFVIDSLANMQLFIYIKRVIFQLKSAIISFIKYIIKELAK